MTYKITVITHYYGQSLDIAHEKAQLIANYAYLATGHKTTANIEKIDDKDQGASA